MAPSVELCTVIEVTANLSRTLTVNQIAGHLGVPAETIEWLCDAGVVPFGVTATGERSFNLGEVQFALGPAVDAVGHPASVAPVDASERAERVRTIRSLFSVSVES